MMNSGFREAMDMPNPYFPIKVMRFQYKNSGCILSSHWHSSVELLYFKKGTALLMCGSKKFHVQPGDLVVVNSNEPHYAENLSGSLDYYCIIFDISLIESNTADACQTHYVSPIAQNLLFFKNHIRKDRIFISHLEKIIQEYESKGFGYELVIKSELFNLLAFLLRNHVEKILTLKENDVRCKHLARLKEVLNYIETYHAEKITLHSLAQIACITPSHFCHVFKDLTGTTVSEHITRVRINRAVHLLLETDMSITETALSVGFNDLNYFCRTFKKVRGVSPSKLRSI